MSILNWKICKECGQPFDIAINFEKCPKCRNPNIEDIDNVEMEDVFG